MADIRVNWVTGWYVIWKFIIFNFIVNLFALPLNICLWKLYGRPTNWSGEVICLYFFVAAIFAPWVFHFAATSVGWLPKSTTDKPDKILV